MVNWLYIIIPWLHQTDSDVFYIFEDTCRLLDAVDKTVADAHCGDHEACVFSLMQRALAWIPKEMSKVGMAAKPCVLLERGSR